MVHSSLEELAGAGETTPEEETWRAVLNDRVPPRWLKVAYPVGMSSLPGFLENLEARFKFIMRWGEEGGELPAYWLSGFF